MPDPKRTCKNCQEEISFSAALCRFCGEESPPPYATLWRRFGAYAVDKVILVTIETIVVILLLMALGPILPFPALPGIGQLTIFSAAQKFMFKLMLILLISLGMVFAWLYFALFEASPLRATPGKLVFRIVVCDNDGNRITFGRASLRFWLKLLTVLTLGVGYLTALFNDQRQTLHDILARTIVLRKT